MNWKGYIGMQAWHLPIYLEGLMNPIDNIRQDNRCPGRYTVQKRIILSQMRDRGELSWAKCETEANNLEPNARHKYIILSQMRDTGELYWAKCETWVYYLEPNARQGPIILSRMRDIRIILSQMRDKLIILSQMRDRRVLSWAKCETESYYPESNARQRRFILSLVSFRSLVSWARMSNVLYLETNAICKRVVLSRIA